MTVYDISTIFAPGHSTSPKVRAHHWGPMPQRDLNTNRPNTYIIVELECRHPYRHGKQLLGSGSAYKNDSDRRVPRFAHLLTLQLWTRQRDRTHKHRAISRACPDNFSGSGRIKNQKLTDWPIGHASPPTSNNISLSFSY